MTPKMCYMVHVYRSSPLTARTVATFYPANSWAEAERIAGVLEETYSALGDPRWHTEVVIMPDCEGYMRMKYPHIDLALIRESCVVASLSSELRE